MVIVNEIKELKKNCDTLLVIPNETLLTITDLTTSVLESFKLADSILNQATKGISDLINMWVKCLTHHNNMFISILKLKNPYTNKVIKRHNLYNI